jgi:ubiquinone/menaquinone biosynthesis C-methylase UbiE
MQQLDPEAIKERQRQEWGRAAAGWRKHDGRLTEATAPVTRRLLELAGLAPGQRVLDIACGTGEPALPAAEVVGAQGYVLGTDLSEKMLSVAQDKARARGLANVEFRQVDGEEIDVDAGSFDAVLCRWGIMFMPEPLRCLRQAHRALRPGGRIALSVWGPPERNPFFTVPMGVLMRYAEVPPPQPGAPGVFAFADRNRLASTLSEAGFRDVQIEDLELPMAVFDSGQEYWQFTREMAAPIAALLEQLPPDVQQKVGQEVALAAARGSLDGRVSLNGYPLFAAGVK